MSHPLLFHCASVSFLTLTTGPCSFPCTLSLVKHFYNYNFPSFISNSDLTCSDRTGGPHMKRREHKLWPVLDAACLHFNSLVWQDF